MIGAQLHISIVQDLIERVAHVENDEMPFRKKPKFATGLWTSSWREETQNSDWVEWCSGENYGDPYKDNWFLLTPKADARLYVIDCYADLERLLGTYSYLPPFAQKIKATLGSEYVRYYIGLDFERLSKDYDGLHLTERGNAKLHLSYPHDMNAWDSESTVWFRWCFTEVQRIETPKPTQQEATA